MELLDNFTRNFDAHYEFQLQLEELKEVYVPEGFLK
jgi:hypothetical protein